MATAPPDRRDFCSRCQFNLDGYCRRFPPVMLPGRVSRAHGAEFRVGWPEVGDHTWCGEFVATAAEQERRLAEAEGGARPPIPAEIQRVLRAREAALVSARLGHTLGGEAPIVAQIEGMITVLGLLGYDVAPHPPTEKIHGS